jgi:DNA-binding LacI/PurR family transcriptional regulator
VLKRTKPKRESESGQRVSLRLLGEYLDLSPATISLVLNNAPGVDAIPQATRDRVKAAADKFEYRPSFYARTLRSRQTFSVGVLVPELSDSYTAHVLTGVEEFLIEEGYFYLTASHRRKPDLIEEYPRLLMERSVEGFIFIDTALTHGFKLPAVAIAGHRTIPGITNVVLNQRRAADLTLKHLRQLGHRHIAFMRGGSHSSDADDRWECIKAAAKAVDILINPDLTVQIKSMVSTPELGVEPTRELLARQVPFTAIVCYDDLAAIGAIRALREHGLRVPHDISVVGFDDIQSAAFNNPSITTIRQPLHEMGKNAARILLQRIRGKGTAPRKVSMLPELIVRESTCPPAGNSRSKSYSKAGC